MVKSGGVRIASGNEVFMSLTVLSDESARGRGWVLLNDWNEKKPLAGALWFHQGPQAQGV